MVIAIEEAKISLREGNCGFGAVIAKNNELIAKAHDTEKTLGDSSAHAEMTVIRSASAKLGRDLSGCVLIVFNRKTDNGPYPSNTPQTEIYAKL